jgi:predicted ATPase
MLRTLAVANYRSLRRFVMPLGQLTVVTGPNGSGKSSVYRSLRLLGEIAHGGALASLAREGGLQSTLWAGPEQFSAAMLRGEQPVQGTQRRLPVHLQMGFAAAGDDGFSYAIDLGLPAPSSVPKAFALDPEIKREALWSGPVLRPAALLVERRGSSLRMRGPMDPRGGWQALERPLPRWASMLTEFMDPRSAPEMLTLRDSLRSWRFYDHFRTDAESSARQPRLGSYTPVLSADGHDLAAALLTILEIGDAEGLAACVADAFAGARISVQAEGSRFTLLMHQPGLLRPLTAAELSDGSLRYLLWTAALLSPRPPGLLVLNEPETSLHPDLLPALGRLIARAATSTQIIVVTHAARLLAALEQAHASADANDDGALPAWQPIHLDKQLGETRIANLRTSETPRWEWLDR